MARLAGFLVLLLVVVGPVGLVLVPGAIVVPGDPVATHEALVAAPGLFRVGLGAEAAVVLIEVALTALLWSLLRPVSEPLAAVATLARAVMTGLQGVGLLIGVAVALGAPSAELVDVAFTLRQATVLTWQLPFGLHLVLLGVLIARSSFLPRGFSVPVGIAGVAYVTHTVVMLLWPEGAGLAEAFVGIAALLGEVPFFLWMLARNPS